MKIRDAAIWLETGDDAEPCPSCEGTECICDECPTCKGTGRVNPLTAPKGFFCAVSTDCPHCDGVGRI